MVHVTSVFTNAHCMSQRLSQACVRVSVVSHLRLFLSRVGWLLCSEGHSSHWDKDLTKKGPDMAAETSLPKDTGCYVFFFLCFLTVRPWGPLSSLEPLPVLMKVPKQEGLAVS